MVKPAATPTTKGGKKYQSKPDDDNSGLPYPYSSGSAHKGNPLNERQPDALTNEKARAAAVFKEYWDRVKSDKGYLAQREVFEGR